MHYLRAASRSLGFVEELNICCYLASRSSLQSFSQIMHMFCCVYVSLVVSSLRYFRRFVHMFCVTHVEDRRKVAKSLRFFGRMFFVTRFARHVRALSRVMFCVATACSSPVLLY